MQVAVFSEQRGSNDSWQAARRCHAGKAYGKIVSVDHEWRMPILKRDCCWATEKDSMLVSR